mmetsp:Transcript_11475/g.23115  ORF Transcript_11475/g.23115 Transcript_11475/m.23115 type:complete len:90 (+) Transcript_11475:109-378(+)
MLLRGYQPKFVPDLESKKIKTRNVEDAEQLDDRIKRMEKMRLLFSEYDQEKKRDENRKGNKVSGKYDVRKTGPCTVVSRNPKTRLAGDC